MSRDINKSCLMWTESWLLHHNQGQTDGLQGQPVSDSLVWPDLLGAEQRTSGLPGSVEERVPGPHQLPDVHGHVAKLIAEQAAQAHEGGRVAHYLLRVRHHFSPVGSSGGGEQAQSPAGQPGAGSWQHLLCLTHCWPALTHLKTSENLNTRASRLRCDAFLSSATWVLPLKKGLNVCPGTFNTLSFDSRYLCSTTHDLTLRAAIFVTSRATSRNVSTRSSPLSGAVPAKLR